MKRILILTAALAIVAVLAFFIGARWGADGPQEPALAPAAGATASPQAAGDGGDAAQQPQAVRGETLSNPLFASNLLSLTILDDQGATAGSASGMIVDNRSGRILYLTVDYTGSFALDTGIRAVPYPAFHAVRLTDRDFSLFNPRSTRESLALQSVLAGDVMRQAPELERVDYTFEPQALPDDFDDPLREYYREHLPELIEAEQQPEGTPVFINTGPMSGIDFEVQSREGEEICEIREFIVTPEGGLAWAIIETSGVLRIGSELIPVPFERLAWDEEAGVFILDLPPEVVEEAPGYISRNEFPNITRPGYDAELLEYWGELAPE